MIGNCHPDRGEGPRPSARRDAAHEMVLAAVFLVSARVDCQRGFAGWHALSPRRACRARKVQHALRGLRACHSTRLHDLDRPLGTRVSFHQAADGLDCACKLCAPCHLSPLSPAGRGEKNRTPSTACSATRHRRRHRQRPKNQARKPFFLPEEWRGPICAPFPPESPLVDPVLSWLSVSASGPFSSSFSP